MSGHEKQRGCLIATRVERRVHLREGSETRLEMQAAGKALRVMPWGVDFIPKKVGKGTSMFHYITHTKTKEKNRKRIKGGEEKEEKGKK